MIDLLTARDRALLRGEVTVMLPEPVKEDPEDEGPDPTQQAIQAALAFQGQVLLQLADTLATLLRPPAPEPVAVPAPPQEIVVQAGDVHLDLVPVVALLQTVVDRLDAIERAVLLPEQATVRRDPSGNIMSVTRTKEA